MKKIPPLFIYELFLHATFQIRVLAINKKFVNQVNILMILTEQSHYLSKISVCTYLLNDVFVRKHGGLIVKPTLTEC